MLIKNEKSIKIIGYPQSSLTEEYCQVFSKESVDFQVMLPEDFCSLKTKDEYQYIIAIHLDTDLRISISGVLDNLNLDCVTYINDYAYVFDNSNIGKGCFVGFHTMIGWNCSIGNHSYIGMGGGVAHDVFMGKNCIVSPGVLIGGRTKIGNNCTFGFKSSVINKVNVIDNVTLGAFSNITKDVTKPGRYVGTIARYVGE